MVEEAAPGAVTPFANENNQLISTIHKYKLASVGEGGGLEGGT